MSKPIYKYSPYRGVRAPVTPPTGISACTASQRAKTFLQPRGGLIRLDSMGHVSLGEGETGILSDEHTHQALIGMSVEYLSRFVSGSYLHKAFATSLQGAALCGDSKQARELLSSIKGLDDVSIANAIRLTRYDVISRGIRTEVQVAPSITYVHDEAIKNVRTMVHRFLLFLDVYGPKVCDGLELQGFNSHHISGCEIDFMTDDTLWDFKVSKNKLTPKHTLQIATYWRVGLHSQSASLFKTLKYIGLYNPRKNEVYYLRVSDINQGVIKIIDNDVIGLY